MVVPAPLAWADAAHRLTLVTSKDSNFESLIANNYRGLQSQPSYAYLRPYMALVRNETGIRVHAYTIEWVEQSSGGYTKKSTQSFVLRHRARPTEDRSIQSGTLRLISPYFNFSPEEYAAFTGFPQFFSTSTLPPKQIGTVVTISLAAVIFGGNDHSLLGASSAELEEKYVAIRHAEHDAGVAVLAKARTGASANEVGVMLLQQSKVRADPFVKSGEKEYLLARAREASDLYGYLRLSGFQALLIRAKEMAQLPKEKKLTPID